MSRRHSAETRRIQQRLERWELQHLRELAAAQATQLETQAERIQDLERWLGDAEASGEMWQHHAMDLQDRMRQAGAEVTVGLTRQGELLVLPASPSNEARPS